MIPTTAPPDADARKQRLAVFLMVFATVLWFAVVSQCAWEDWFIAYRSSRNLAMGQGLVYTPGQRVYSFSSPIGALLPAALCFLTGGRDALVLWLFRLINAAALGMAAVLLLRLAQALRLQALALATLLALFAFDSKIVGFSAAGMETAYLMLCLAAILHIMIVPGSRPVPRLGLAWGAVMWTRPDGFIFAGALAAGFFLFATPNALAQTRAALLRGYLRAAAIAALVYGPWLLWTWYYFGSPVPNTIIAKGLNDSGLLDRIMAYPSRIVWQNLDATFLPPYGGVPGWHAADLILPLFRPLQLIALLYWLVPGGRREARALSFGFLCGHFYLNAIVPVAWPWYFSAIDLLAFVIFAAATQDLIERSRTLSGRWRAALLAGLAIPAATVLLQLALFGCVAYQLRVRQIVIEDGGRKQLGLWLKSHAASPGDTVMLECPGYIGFYSNLRTYDFPGLTSPEMVAARRKLKTDQWAPLIAELRPDWLVLRPQEAAHVQEQNPQLLRENYEMGAVFDVSSQLAAYHWLPGRGGVQHDQTFIVMHRKPAQSAGPQAGLN